MNRDDHATLTLQDETGASVLLSSDGTGTLSAELPPKVSVFRQLAVSLATGRAHWVWTWSCKACDDFANGCAHHGLHADGSWQAAMCGGLRHVHIEHPRPGNLGHATLFGRARCETTPPTRSEAGMAHRLLLSVGPVTGRMWEPNSPESRAFAREILALESQALTSGPGLIDFRP